MKRFAFAVVVVAVLAALPACDDKQIIDLTAPGPMVPLVSGPWQAVVTSSTLANSVWSMTLTQEGVALSGSWVDDVNAFDGTFSGSVSEDLSIIGTMVLNVRPVPGAPPTCTGAAEVRGTVAAGAAAMSWSSSGWGIVCAGAPSQVVMQWRPIR